MDFATSSQRKLWLFTIDGLAKERQQTRDAFLSQSKAATGTAPEPISLAEEAGLLRHYQDKLVVVSANLKLPRKVLSTSVIFVKRFYLKRSSLDLDPQQMALTCLYLACKTEDCYISAAELGRLVGMPADALLKMELTLLQGLQFDLQVHSHYRALEGCIIDLQEWAARQGAEAGGLADAQLQQDARLAAYKAADCLLLSDAPLVFTPGQLGLHALRAGLLGKTEAANFQQYLAFVAQRGGVEEEQLRSTFCGVDAALLASAERTLDLDGVAAVDRKLKEFRAAELAAAKEKKKD